MLQGSQEWLNWRRQGIGASDVPVVMGMSEWATPFQLWEQKTGRAPEQENNWAMQRGTDAEPKIRALYELHNDMDMPATVAEHPEYPFIRASLDGHNEAAKGILEIKYPSQAKQWEAEKGKVPDCYVAQVQAQLFVTGAEWCDYVSFDGENIAVVRVKPDLEFQAKMLQALIEFWNCIVTDTPPELTDDDLKEVKAPEAIQLFTEFKEAKKAADEATKKAEALNKKIKEMFPEGQIYCAGYQLVKAFRAGSVDVTQIPQLQGVDLTPYKKPGTLYLTIKPKKAG